MYVFLFGDILYIIRWSRLPKSLKSEDLKTGHSAKFNSDPECNT